MNRIRAALTVSPCEKWLKYFLTFCFAIHCQKVDHVYRQNASYHTAQNTQGEGNTNFTKSQAKWGNHFDLKLIGYSLNKSNSLCES